MLKGPCVTYRSKYLLKRRSFRFFVIFFAVLFLSTLGNAPEAVGQPGSQAFGDLLYKAHTGGSVRIIVRLNMPFVPEGLLSTPQAAVDQQARISAMHDRLLEALSDYNAKDIRRYKHAPYTAMEVDSTVLWALSSNPLVISFTEDVPVPPTLTESIPLIKADQAWTSGYTGLGWTVAILDTGVDKDHSFFSGGKVAAEACFSTTSLTYSSTTVCPNGLNSQTGSGAGKNCSGTITGCDHGTHVAGIAAGKAASVNGVAKEANIIAVQIFSRFTGINCINNGLASPCILTYVSDQDAALEHVYSLRTTHNIAAINLSLGGGRYYTNCDSENSSTKAVIDNLRSAGIATVIASGNNGYCDSICSPACISTAVSVGNTTKSDAETSNSNYHPTMLSLFAPGSSIYSSIPGGGWGYKSGTSMAAPHVTGALAILKQKSPTASVDSLLNDLKNKGVPVTSRCAGQKPRINILAALSDSPPNSPSGLTGSTSSAGGIALSWIDNSFNETGFKVERKTGVSGIYGEIASVGANATTYSDTGLSAGTTYYYRVRAYNTSGYSSYSNEVDAIPLSPGGGGGAANGGGGGGGCFIATAAYGSYLAPEVEVLRRFRNDYIITNPLGRTFVAFYYRVSPPIAEYISRHEGLKWLTRCALSPVVYGLKYPFVFLIFLSFVPVVRIMRKNGLRGARLSRLHSYKNGPRNNRL